MLVVGFPAVLDHREAGTAARFSPRLLADKSVRPTIAKLTQQPNNPFKSNGTGTSIVKPASSPLASGLVKRRREATGHGSRGVSAPGKAHSMPPVAMRRFISENRLINALPYPSPACLPGRSERLPAIPFGASKAVVLLHHPDKLDGVG